MSLQLKIFDLLLNTKTLLWESLFLLKIFFSYYLDVVEIFVVFKTSFK